MISQRSVDAIDVIRRLCGTYATPELKRRVSKKSSRRPEPLPSSQEIMRKFGHAIAFSQNARSISVRNLIYSGVLDRSFSNFDHNVLSRQSAKALCARSWSELGCLRFKSKLDSILLSARVLKGIDKDCSSFSSYLLGFGIPRRIGKYEDLEAFWVGFNKLQDDLRIRKMPFFGQTTSLLQLLLGLDYDSIKPDLIIMRLAARIGLCHAETGDQHFREAVWSLQAYGVLRRIRPALLDIYLLAFGGQTEARTMLQERFCPGPGKCQNSVCTIGRNKLCKDYS